MAFLPWSSAGLPLSPSYYFVLDYVFINQILHFLSFPSLCLTVTPVRISSITERLSLYLHWLPRSPPFQTVASTLLAGTTLQRDFPPPTLIPVWILYWDNRLSFGFLTLDNGTEKLSPETSVRNYYCSLRYIPDESNSYLPCGGNLKSRMSEYLWYCVRRKSLFKGQMFNWNCGKKFRKSTGLKWCR